MDTSTSSGPDIGAWYARYATRLRGVTRRIVGNDDDAEDATQDAFLAAFRARHRYLPQMDPYPWLYRIATRKALTIAATHRPRPDREPAEAGGASFSVPSAEDEALAGEAAQHLRRLLATELPVALHVLGQLRFRDVSERLGIPRATAATRIRRGKQRLRALLEADNKRASEANRA